VNILLGLLFYDASPTRLAEHWISSIFHPLTSPARSEFNYAMLVLAICAVIFVVVATILIFTMVRFRRRPEDGSRQEPPQVYGSNRIEAAWTVIPVLVVFVLAGVTARVVWGIEDASPPKSTVHVQVTGHQYWWEVRYPYYRIVTANEIHIPVSHNHQNATYFELKSTDVLHSLWLPELGGKTDLIPNRVNHMWMDPAEAGVYWGSCTEFCGVQHANMLASGGAGAR
jgi:cytochrome c oxidase subunit 2